METRSLCAILFILILFYTANGQEVYQKYKDARQPLMARIKDLMKRMTLAEKIGQMTQIEEVVSTSEVVKQYFIGSVFSGGGSSPGPNATVEDWIDMVTEIQNGAIATRLGIPLIYGLDAVHGQNNAYNATIFPHNIALGVTRDPQLIKRIGAATALEVRATGITYAFAPSLAVCRDPRWGRCYESYSEDHDIVEAMTEIIPGLQGDIPSTSRKGVPFVAGKEKVAACAKHFVGDGGTYKGINAGNSIIDAHELFNVHMPAYLDAVYKGVSTIMLSLSSWNGKKMHSNYKLISDVLKNKIGFKGFVISDWQGIDDITDPKDQNYTYSIQTSINAGLDMIMVPYDYINFIGNLTYLVENNAIPMSRIDDAVKRILKVKFTMGLFENPFPDRSLINQLGSQEHRDLAREAVRKSLVLLKNTDPKGDGKTLLPLPKMAPKILVAGTHAHNLGYQCGGWTIEWQGFSGNNKTRGTTILEAINSAVHPSTSVIFSENPDVNLVEKGNFSYAIVVVGEIPYAETMGDDQNLTLSKSSIRTIENVCGTSVDCVVILITGRPVVIEPHLSIIDALVAAWLPGSEGKGVTDVLYGDHPFTGRLAMTWFRNIKQLPMNVGDPHYDPLFPFGFGMGTTANSLT